MQTKDEAFQKIVDYHELSKHGYHRLAPNLGYMDWENQPDPFRRYEGAESVPLKHFEHLVGRSFDDTLIDGHVPSEDLNFESVSQLFYDSLALSAWKSYRGSKWALRVNPSSGNLHPTEGYLISGPVDGLFEEPSISHYLSKTHSLEKRATFPIVVWESLKEGFPEQTIFIGLSSIYWREAWKYGERAFRYCNHDIGHAIGAISIACAELGWVARLIENVGRDYLQTLFGLNQKGHPEEIEDADCIIAVYKKGYEAAHNLKNVDNIQQFFSEINWSGEPNTLSKDHFHWGALHEVALQTKKPNLREGPAYLFSEKLDIPIKRDQIPLRKILRQRRSAVAMDGKTSISKETFYQILLRIHPRLLHPFETLPWEPHVNLGLFVHRVKGLDPGIYFLFRNPTHFEKFVAPTREKYLWEKPSNCPSHLDFYLLQKADVLDTAMSVSCRQDIASDGCFSLGMLTHFEDPIKRWGAWFYPRLYWECGFVGQVLYLLAEKYGIRSTGIGCFFDDPVHEIFGISNHEFQTLYHFTFGGAVVDDRLTTLPPYENKVSQFEVDNLI